MRGRVYHRPERHRIRDLTVEPDVLVGGEEPGDAGANDKNDVAQHGDEDQATIEGKDETGTPGRPDGPGEAVESGQLLVGSLRGCATGMRRGTEEDMGRKERRTWEYQP